MNTPRILLAATAAMLLSSATAFAAPPSADQVSVPQGYEGHHGGKMMAVFSSPEERMMFKTQMREVTRGMSRDQRKAYRKEQVQKIRAMNDAEKAAWRHGLQAKWDAMPAAQQTLLAQKMERRAEKHQQRHQSQGQYQDDQQNMNAPQQ